MDQSQSQANFYSDPRDSENIVNYTQDFGGATYAFTIRNPNARMYVSFGY